MLTSLLTGCIGDMSEETVATIVEETLYAKPEIIVKALNSLREREEAKQAESQKEILENASQDLTHDKHSLVLGNPDGDVTVVAFKDYRCGFCKKVWPTVHELIAKDKNIRLVFKEFPVLGPDSELASRFALATSIQGQDKYRIFNDVLMNHPGPWDAQTLKAIAKSKGIDADKMEKDAGEKFVSDAITDNMKIGQALGIQGTPAFVIGKKLIPGAVQLDYLENAVKEAREENKESKSDDKKAEPETPKAE